MKLCTSVPSDVCPISAHRGGRLGAALVLTAWLAAPPAMGVQIYDTFPEEIHPDERYVIYSHGLIVEGDDPRPVHAEFGAYDFPAIKNALFESGGFNLIAHQRAKNTAVEPYVDTLASWVHELVAAGVSPERITLVGFSRGAQLTAYASSRLRELGFGTALLAVCIDGDLEHDPPVVLGGHVLSIYETTDVVKSCASLARRSRLSSFEEISISTGRRHGAFYQPLVEWLEPLKAWIARTNRSRDQRRKRSRLRLKAAPDRPEELSRSGILATISHKC